MSNNISGKVALVTGANRGIGEAIVEAFIAQGASKVYLAVRTPNSTKEIEQRFGDKVITLKADVSDADSIKALAVQAPDVDILVNNAGIMHFASPLSQDAEAALRDEFEINVFGLLRMAQAFEKVLEKNKGTLVQLNSIASIKNFADVSTYCASKSAAYSITQGLREKLAEKNVSVVSVHPGPIATDMGKGAGFDNAPSADTVANSIVEAINEGHFFVFPDPAAKKFEQAYESFAKNAILGDLSIG